MTTSPTEEGRGGNSASISRPAMRVMISSSVTSEARKVPRIWPSRSTVRRSDRAITSGSRWLM
ncbi:hypothetical protein ACFSTC_28030 [Nonomuraea ferruginea]